MQCRNLRAWLIIFIVFDQSKSQSSKGRDIVTITLQKQQWEHSGSKWQKPRERKREGGGENQWETDLKTRLFLKQDFS